MTIKPEEIAVLTLHTPEIASYGNIAERNREWYCRHHGYGCHVQATSLRPERHPSWSKLDMANSLLQQYKWLFWLDADAMIMNRDIRLEDIIQVADPNHDFLVCCDFHGLLNAGAWFIRNTEPAAKMLSEWMASTYDGMMWEQVALWRMFAAGMPCSTGVFPYPAFNSYFNYWKPGEFVAHFTGGLGDPPLNTEQRTQAMVEAERMIRAAQNNPQNLP